MKRFLKVSVLVLALVLLIGLSSEKSFADSNIKINVMGREVKSDVAPFYLKGRTMVPVRFVSEALGARVDWNGESQSITIEKPKTKELYINLKDPMQNSMGAANYAQGGYYGASSYGVYLDVAPVIRKGRTFLPARIIAEELGYYVSWDGATNTVNISKEYLGGETYKQYLKSQNKDPHEWSPLLKDQFEAAMVESGYVKTKDELIYEKAGAIDGEGYYGVYIKYNGKLASLVTVNAKTGWYHG